MSSSGSWFAALAVVLIVASCNLVNDIVDAAADSFDRPERPLAAGTIDVRHVMSAALISTLGGLAFAATLGLPAAVAAAGFLVAGIAYSLFVRRLPILGHVWVAFMFGGTVVWGGWVTSGITTEVWMAALLVALFLLPRELLKSLGDVRGDRLSGWRTAAVVWGRESTIWALSATSVLFAVATTTPVLRGVAEGGYLVAIWLGTVIPLLALVVRLWRRPDGDLRRLEFLSGLLWFPGLAALWLLGPVG